MSATISFFVFLILITSVSSKKFGLTCRSFGPAFPAVCSCNDLILLTTQVFPDEKAVRLCDFKTGESFSGYQEVFIRRCTQQIAYAPVQLADDEVCQKQTLPRHSAATECWRKNNHIKGGKMLFYFDRDINACISRCALGHYGSRCQHKINAIHRRQTASFVNRLVDINRRNWSIFIYLFTFLKLLHLSICL